MANTAKEVLALAAGEVGTTSGRKYVKFYNELTGIGLPLDCSWCACFVTWCMRKAGVPESSVCNYKGCVTGVDWFKKQGRFKSRQSGYSPKPGDVIFFEWSPGNEGTSRDDGSDHTGIVEKVSGGTVHTIEGNGGDYYSCCRRTYSLSSSVIEGYGVPLYNAGGSPSKPEEPVKPTVKSVSVKTWTSTNSAGRVLDVAAKVNRGKIWYQVHVLGGSWLPKVTGYDIKDDLNGYAGNGKPIDALRVYYDTPAGEPYQQARYAVKTEKSSGWLPEQVDDSTEDGMDGYAGNLGQAITAIKVRVAAK